MLYFTKSKSIICVTNEAIEEINSTAEKESFK